MIDDPLLKGGPQSPEKLMIDDPLLKGGPQPPERLMIDGGGLGLHGGGYKVTFI